MSYLVLVRHGESQWNAKGWWTGLTDIGLTEKGVEEAKSAGDLLTDIHFDIAYTSVLRRAQDTLAAILDILELPIVPIIQHEALNERDYGVYTGKNKWTIKEEIGEEKFQKIRRGWDEPIPGGETLKDVYARVMPYYQDVVSKDIEQGKHVLIVAHGNSLRALIKHLENVPDEKIASIELKTGEVYVYTLNEKGIVIKKEIRTAKNSVAFYC